MGRAPCCDKANVKKGPWSPEEDAKLKAYIEKYGTGGNWIALPQKIGLKRCGKSCRLRWLNYLRPNIKHGGFSEEEDNIICSLYISIGSRWSIIAAQLPGRTDNDIKNYWNTRLKKKLLGRRKASGVAARLSSVNPELKDFSPSGFEDSEALSSSAMERLQLHMQLQSLQNPLSFYANPALWPKLHPFQHKMLQSFHCLDGAVNPSPHCLTLDTPVAQAQKVNFYGEAPGGSDVLGVGNNMVAEQSVDHVLASNGNHSAFQDELENILNGEAASFNVLSEHHHDHINHHQNQISEFDCFKDMSNVSKEAMLSSWWSTEMVNDAKSASSSSWDSSSAVLDHDQSNAMFHSYDRLSYGL